MRKGAKRKAEELSAGKWLSSAEQLTSEVSKKMQEDYQSAAFRLLVTTPWFGPVFVEQQSAKFAIQAPGRERDFSYP